MIRATVGLPMYKSGPIAWLALESLCRQREVSFDWELVIVEEQAAPALGIEGLAGYRDRLQAVGCADIIYLQLASWIPLARKWRLIARLSSATSKVFFIQDADCFSQPLRLAETMDIFGPASDQADWVQSRQGVFYEVATGRQLLYDHALLNRPNATALNMAVRTDLIRNLPDSDAWHLTNGWTYRSCAAQLARPIRVAWNESESWTGGVDTHGLGNISRRRRFFDNPKPPYAQSPIDVTEHLPTEITQGLEAMAGQSVPERRVKENL